MCDGWVGACTVCTCKLKDDLQEIELSLSRFGGKPPYLPSHLASLEY